MLRSAFSLIEMLVVVSIIALLSTMIIFMFEDSAEDAISKSALELKSVLERARSMAIKSGRMHAVAFHIENAGDGSVLKNFSHIDNAEFPGRHWYCIIGPDYSDIGTTAGYDRSPDKIPVASEIQSGKQLSFYSLSDYIETMKSVQVGARHYLLPGVRFLALGDEDTIYPGYNNPTYPRPWFGYYDNVQNRLYPWGAWNPEIDSTLPFPSTGLDYRGEDALPTYNAASDTIINPPAVWGRIHANATAPDEEWVTDGSEDFACNYNRGFTQGFVGPDTYYLASTATRKVARPLINAYWGDYMILFDARGTARSVVGEGRWVYFRGLRGYSGAYSSRGSSNNFSRYDMGVNDQASKTGGFYLTICRDIDDGEQIYGSSNAVTGGFDYSKFNNVEDAFLSITPFKRLFVWRATGTVEMRDMTHPQCAITPADLLQKKAYPHGY